MPPQLDFLFDFGSPNAYFAHRAIPGIEARTGATFTYVPVLLGGIFKATNNQSPVTAYGHVKNKPEYDRLEMTRFIKRHRLFQFTLNPHFPVNTLAIMRGAVAAEELGAAAAYIEAMFHFMWEEPRKLDDLSVIRDTLGEVGLDAAALMAAAQTPEVKQRLTGNTERAVARGVFGAPSFFIDEELYFGKDRLREVEEEILRAR